MGWADFAIEKLKSGQTAKIIPHGNSMRGKVNSGDTVILKPCSPEDLKTGDVVLVKVKGRIYLHLIKATKDNRFLIGNNRGGVNGWVGGNSIYGIATEIKR